MPGQMGLCPQRTHGWDGRLAAAWCMGARCAAALVGVTLVCPLLG
jgi:hypothetical protein